MPPKKTTKAKPKTPAPAPTNDDEEPSSSSNKEEETAEPADFVEFAPVLGPSQSCLDPEEASEEYLHLFPDSFWSFPVVDRKDGHLTSFLDPIGQKLQAQAASCSGPLQARYEERVAEWRVLRQSVVYGQLISAALTQVGNNLDEQADNIDLEECDLRDVIQQLQAIVINLTSDQLARASVLITAAEHSNAGAEKIEFSLRAPTLGLHPAALKHFTDLGPAPSRRTQDSKWAPSKKAQSSSTTTNATKRAFSAKSTTSGHHKPQASSSPAKGGNEV